LSGLDDCFQFFVFCLTNDAVSMKTIQLQMKEIG
jgi:hypothetical protein